MTPVNVDADTKVRLKDSCNCSCPSRCLIICGNKKKKKHTKACRVAQKTFDDMVVENKIWKHAEKKEPL